jgi:hypothetical protein
MLKRAALTSTPVRPRRFVLVLVVVLESGRAECWSVGVLRQVRIAPA